MYSNGVAAAYSPCGLCFTDTFLGPYFVGVEYGFYRQSYSKMRRKSVGYAVKIETFWDIFLIIPSGKWLCWINHRHLHPVPLPITDTLCHTFICFIFPKWSMIVVSINKPPFFLWSYEIYSKLSEGIFSIMDQLRNLQQEKEKKEKEKKALCFKANNGLKFHNAPWN